MKDNPVVSVCCITYNHEPYISQAIEGFLMQKTNFPIEIIIHDDASTDKTAEIIRKYVKVYPDIIKPLFQTENQYSKGVKPNLTYNFPRAKGKYIALCEGDDYWIDPYKLQKQVDFMEANEDFSLCFTNCKLLDLKGNITKGIYLEKQSEKEFTHLDMPVFAPAQTMLFRNKYINSIPKSFLNAPGGDAYLEVWLSKCGKIKYHNFNSAVYRITNQGVYTGKNDFQKARHLIQTYYAILDIVEKDSIEKFIYLLIGAFLIMKKNVKTDSEILISKSYYNEMCNFLKKEKRLNRINLFSYNRFRLYLILYNRFDNLLIKVIRNRVPGFVKAAFRKYANLSVTNGLLIVDPENWTKISEKIDV
jgi:glycosyltransferase involved in cell wall biosynthesis